MFLPMKLFVDGESMRCCVSWRIVRSEGYKV